MPNDNCQCVSPQSGDAPTNVLPVTPALMERSIEKYARMVKENYERSLRTGNSKTYAGVDANIPVFIYGAPGIGKTDIVNQVGKKLGMAVYTFIASTMDPSDVRGIPVANQERGYSSWLPPRDFKADAKRPASIYFFDELNLAPADVRAAFYQLILSGKLEDIDISNSLRIGAGNNKGLVPELHNAWLGTPLATRFNTYWMLPDLGSWVSYARQIMPDGKPRVEPIVVDFITKPQSHGSSESSENILYCVNPNIECIGLNNATPRGWVKVSDMIRHGITEQSDFTSAVGMNWGLRFYTYFQDRNKHRNEKEIREL